MLFIWISICTLPTVSIANCIYILLHYCLYILHYKTLIEATCITKISAVHLMHSFNVLTFNCPFNLYCMHRYPKSLMAWRTIMNMMAVDA